MRFNDWLRGKNREGEGDDVEFYEDTHDEHGNYIGRQAGHAAAMRSSVISSPSSTQMSRPSAQAGKTAAGMTTSGQAGIHDSAKPFGNIVVYRPGTPEEVETLINFLRNGKPAVANLDGLEDGDAQRILDFLSGAIFALGGNIHRITGNIFILSPAGVEIQSHYDKN